MFKQFINAIIESSLGRIHWHSNMWAIIGTRWDKKRIENKNLIGSKHVNEQGQFIREDSVLVQRLSVWNCPNPPSDEFHQTNTGNYMVPATECRKCPYHRPTTKQVKFPLCTFNKNEDVKEAIKDGLGKAEEITQTAIDKANRMLGQ